MWEIIAAIIVFFTIFYLFATRKFGYWAERGVPYVKPLPFLGNMKNLFLLKVSSGTFFEDLYKKMPGKPYVGFFILDRPALAIRDPKLIKNILVKDFNYFADRFCHSDVQSDPLGYKNLFVIKGLEWKILRNKMSPTFTSGRMKKMFHLVAKCNSQMVDYLENVTADNPFKAVDIKEISAKCTTDVIASCAFGINSNTLQDPKAEFRVLGKKFFEYTVLRALEMLTFFYVPWLVKITRSKFFEKEANDFYRKVFWDTIQLREKSNIKRNDLIDQLIELKNEGKISVQEKEDNAELDNLDVDDNDSKFDFHGDDLVAQASVFFIAGFESSSSTISFCLYELALQPETQRRLRNEIAGALNENDGKITYDLIFGLKYLDMVISETLRLYPTLPFLDRICLKDYYIPETGLTIEKDTPIYIPLDGLQRDPQYFPNPEKFDPERFSDENKRNLIPYTNLPFGAGPHNCIGMRFGLMSTKSGIVHLLKNFEVEVTDETPIPMVLNTKGIAITTKQGVPLRFKKSPLT